MSIRQIDIVYISLSLFICAFQTDYSMFLFLVFFICSIKQVNKNTLIILLVLLLRLFIVSPIGDESGINNASVSEINESSYVVKSNEGNYLLIYDKELLLDDCISFKGELIENVDSPHFYGFDYECYAKQKELAGTIYCETLDVIQESKTVRGNIQKKIYQLDELYRPLYMKLILSQDVASDGNIVILCGFQWSLIFYLIFKSANSIMDKDKAFTLQLLSVLITILCLSSSFNLYRYLFFLICSKTKYNKYVNIACFTILTYLINPYLLTSLSFMLPIGLRMLPKPYFWSRTVYLCLMQSFFFSSVNFIQLFLYSIVRYIYALLTILCIVDLLLSTTFIPLIYPLFVSLNTFLFNPFFISYGKLPLFIFLLFMASLFYKPNVNKIKRMTIIVVFVMGFSQCAPYAEVTMINIGQGDSMLVRMPFNQLNILIDTGMESSYDDLKAYLMAKGIKRIDKCIITHEDEDHCGGLELLQKDFDVVVTIKDIKDFSSSSLIDIQFLTTDIIYDNLNDNSLVTYFNMNGIHFLCTGDISGEVEDDLMTKYDSLDVNVLKVAHHGSNTSTSSEFLSNLKPDLALISSGVNNRYHHPSSEVIKRLDNKGIPFLNTQQEGDISIIMTRFFNFVITANQQFVIMNTVIK